MDKYFYIIEQGDNGKKVIHMQGNIYYNDEKECYEHAEWVFLYIEIPEAKQMISTNNFYDYVDVRIRYFENITEEIAAVRIENYFDEQPGKHLNIADITEDTPCGCYWFDREENIRE